MELENNDAGIANFHFITNLRRLPPSHISGLPDDVVVMIFERLDVKTRLMVVPSICKSCGDQIAASPP